MEREGFSRASVTAFAPATVSNVACGFDGAATDREDIVLHQAVHAGDADSRKQPADGGGN